MRLSIAAVGWLAGILPFFAAPVQAQSGPLPAIPPQISPSVSSLRELQNDVTRVVARSKHSIVAIFVRAPRSAFEENKADAQPAITPPTPGTAPTDAPSTGAPAVPDPASTDPTLFEAGGGTGWVVRSDGLIVTNYHVVRGASSIHVTFNADGADSASVLRGIGLPARVVGFDIAADIAVIKVDRTNLPVLELGDSDAIEVGQWLVAIGIPLTQVQTAVLGVLTGRERDVSDEGGSAPPPTYLQTDALLIPGDSGGPLLDLGGRVVGLNTKGVDNEPGFGSMGYALPSNTIRRLLPQLMAGQPTRRAALGFETARLSSEAAREFGVSGGFLVAAAPDDAAVTARAAGLHQGDIITDVDEKTLDRPALQSLLASHSPGDTIRLGIARPDFAGTGNVERLTVSMVLSDSASLSGSDAPAFAPAPVAPIKGSGLTVADAKSLDAAHRKKWGYKGRESGAVVAGVAALSPADQAFLQEGTRILRARLDGTWTDIPSASAWKTLEARAAPGAHLLLQLRSPKNTAEFRVLVLPAKTG